MSDNPFLELLDEFRTAAATLDTREFFLIAHWRPDSFSQKHEIFLGSCKLPVAGEVEYSHFSLTVTASGNCQKSGTLFANLASRAGSLLQPEVCAELVKHYPALERKTAPLWYALLWKLAWDRPVHLDPGEGEPAHLPIMRPFLVSVHAIEVCNLHADSPCLPETTHPLIAELAGATLRWAGSAADTSADSGDEDQTEPAASGDWFASEPPEGSRYKHGPVEGQISELADWMNVDRRTLRSRNGKGSWWIQKEHSRKFLAWFATKQKYAEVNQRRLAAESRNDTK